MSCAGYTFPGNVRELRNAIERAWFLSEGDVILPTHLPDRLSTAQHPSEGKAMSVDEVVDKLCRQAFAEGETTAIGTGG
ncbi:MAG: hypothetical protein U5N86_00350 [Planctomycetota bacterium]|nr:hypothetical protein [Planctomycetota bacterium]